MSESILSWIEDLWRPAPPVPQPAPASAAPTSAPAAAPTTAAPPPPHPVATIPDDDLTFVEDEEDGSPAYYVKHFQGFEFPGVASGPTIGVGFDCGYATAKEAQAAWTGIVDAATVAEIVKACGLRGPAAEAFVRAHASSVRITWDQAVAEFKQHEVPQWLARCRAALPNFDELPGDCQGALFSLSYNRGTGGYDDPGQRDAEMRAIKALMRAKDFAKIPAEILSMQRLWPKVPDLRNRRAHEATMFQKGLAGAK